MASNIQICEVAAQPLAVVRDRANGTNIGERIVELLSEAWDFLQTSGVPHTGHNVAVYLNEDGGASFLSEEGVPVEIGVQVVREFEGQGRVVCSASPAGTAATAAHFGPYEKLGETHDALRRWCQESGHSLAGPVWEIYGHWTDNPDEQRTDVFYLLKSREGAHHQCAERE